MSFPYSLLEDPEELATYGGWSEEVYRDFLALQRGEMTQDDFDTRYATRKAVLILDLTGFTVTASNSGALHSFLRIFDAQKVCLPVLQDTGANFVRTFADDLVALFDEPGQALDAALELHHRIALFNRSDRVGPYPTDCCVGIGYGTVYRIGPDCAMGDEMNRASKLGEDTARGGETLLTERTWAALPALSRS